MLFDGAPSTPVAAHCGPTSPAPVLASNSNIQDADKYAI